MQRVRNKSRYLRTWILLLTLCLSFIPSMFIAGKPALGSNTIVTSISASNMATYAIKSDGSVLAWGYSEPSYSSWTWQPSPILMDNLTDLKVIENGGQSIGLKADGTVWTWANNYSNNRFFPIQVQGLSDVSAVAAGDSHYLVLKADGTVWSWGNNAQGQLGYNTYLKPQNNPLPILGLNNVIAIAAAGNRSLALKNDGTVWSWGGYNSFYDKDAAQNSVPTEIQGLSDIKAIRMSTGHSLALQASGSVWSWDDLTALQYTVGHTADQTQPLQIKNLTDISSISVSSDHSLALTKDGLVWAWGRNSSGQLGDGTKVDKVDPVQISNLKDVSQISAGPNFSVALKTDGSVWSWGTNSMGQLGDGTYNERLQPVQALTYVPPMVVSTEINDDPNHPGDSTRPWIKLHFNLSILTSSATNSTIQLLDQAGHVIASTVSYNSVDGDKIVTIASQLPLNRGTTYTISVSGIIGRSGLAMSSPYTYNFTINRAIPLPHEQISAGSNHSLRLTTSGKVFAWGANDFGQIGDGTTIPRFIPVEILGLSDIVSISAGASHNLALKKDGTVWAWGYNTYGQIGDGTTKNRLTPVQIAGLSNIVAISAGFKHSLALDINGKVWAWGGNSEGELAIDSTIDEITPIQIPNITDIVSISAGGKHSLALNADGTVWAWGSNSMGQLGNGTSTQQNSPVQVLNLDTVSSISAGFEHSLALKSDGTLQAWGRNDLGQLGDGTTTNHNIPEQLQSLDKIYFIDAGYNFSLAIKGGALWAWGDNRYSELGLESTEDYKSTPVQVNGWINFTAVSGGGRHSLALTTDVGKVTNWGWGYNGFGQVGNGTVEHSFKPVESHVDQGAIAYRLSGKNRTETAVAVSQEGWYYGATNVIITRDDNFPDALTGAPLAYSLNAPILLTNSKTLSPETSAEILRLNPENIFILGSPGAVSTEIENQLAAKYKVTRLGGSDRYETSAKILNYLKDNHYVNPGKVVMAYGLNFPDALAVSSLAAYQHIPILLTDTHTIPDPTMNAIQNLGVDQTIIVGSDAVVGEDVAKQLPNVTRYGGSDRYQTALKIAKGMGADLNTIYVATGNNFPDALAGSVQAAWTNSPILLVDQNLPKGVPDYLLASANMIKDIFFLGSDKVVPDSIFDEIAQTINP